MSQDRHTFSCGGSRPAFNWLTTRVLSLNFYGQTLRLRAFITLCRSGLIVQMETGANLAGVPTNLEIRVLYALPIVYTRRKTQAIKYKSCCVQISLGSLSSFLVYFIFQASTTLFKKAFQDTSKLSDPCKMTGSKLKALTWRVTDTQKVQPSKKFFNSLNPKTTTE